MREIALHMADIAENSLAAGAARIKLSVMIDRAADRLTTAVEDNGRGIPVDMHEKMHKSALEVALTVLHAGGKFGGSGYKVSGGLHGVGLSVVNALSTWLIAEVKRDGKLYYQEYSYGEPKAPVKAIKDIPEGESGTSITFQR